MAGLQDLEGPLHVASRARRLSLRVRRSLMDLRRRRPIDQQAEQFGAAVMTTRVHESLAGVDLSEIEICDYLALAGFERLADDLAVRAHNGSEAAVGDQPDRTTCILRDLGLLVGIEPRRRVDDEAGGFESMLADADFHLLRKRRAVNRSGIHDRVNLFAVGDQRVTCERQEVLPAGELPDAPDSAVHGAKARAVALAPDDALAIGRRDLATALDQRAVRVEQKLSVVDRAAVALVDADRDDHVRRLRGLPDRVGLGRGHRDRLLEQTLMLLAHGVGRLHEAEIGVVRDHCLGERRELDALLAQLANLLHNLLDGADPAVEHGADLHGGGFNDGAHCNSFQLDVWNISEASRYDVARAR